VVFVVCFGDVCVGVVADVKRGERVLIYFVVAFVWEILKFWRPECMIYKKKSHKIM
jgi:hypothetical protein